MPLFFLIQLTLSFVLLMVFVLVYFQMEFLNLHPIVTLILSIFVTYVLSIILLVAINKSARTVMRVKEGEIRGLGLVLWTIQETSLDIALNLSSKLFIHTPSPDFLYRLFGFKRRKGVSILTRLWDPDLFDIGENTLIGTDAIVSGHYIKNGVLHRKKVKIGKNVTLGARCILGVGVIIGDNTIVGYGSVIPPHSILDPNSFYSGVPVKKVKILEETKISK
ncbi:hypothetical protein CEE45_04560 [Candidatus Heimdallarchaeota archaeon B3_Heim]|nr:MAG: hypothetical protein CEE45_04560 [Candidatus Heimdallarchaeota archaeon B3_Heim]